jgi:hypothetical protein
MVDSLFPTPKNLTKNEVRVISTLLGGSLESEEDRIRSSEVPRSTYLEIKRRLYSNGVLEDRYVPAPAVVGAYSVSFLLSRPFSEQRVSAIEKISNERGAILVWSGAQSILSTIFHSSSQDAKSFRNVAVEEESFGRVLAHIEIHPEEPTVPVYFDYEGAWNHFSQLEGSTRYPRELPFGRGTVNPPTSKFKNGLMDLLTRPFGNGTTSRPPHLLSPSRLTHSQRRMLYRNYIEWRTFLCLKYLGRFDGRRMTHIVLVSGKMRLQDTMPDLFRALVGGCGVFPFLFAFDSSDVILGLLAAGGAPSSDGLGSPGPRIPVLPTISQFLSNIEIIRESISHLSVHRSHRYDLLPLVK